PSPRLVDLGDVGRRNQDRHIASRVRRLLLQHYESSGGCLRSASHHSALPRHRPHAPDVSISRPPFPVDGHCRQGCEVRLSVMTAQPSTLVPRALRLAFILAYGACGLTLSAQQYVDTAANPNARRTNDPARVDTFRDRGLGLVIPW